MIEDLRRREAWSPESDRRYTRNRIGRSRPESREVLGEFAEWLVERRGLAASTVTVRLGCAGTLVDALVADSGLAGVEVPSRLTADWIEGFFVAYAAGHGLAARRSMRSAMVAWLQFAEERGWVDPERAATVPSVVSRRLAHVPRGVSDEDLRTLLRAPWPGRCPRRDRAIVLLLATYGVRRGQVSALRLTDIDWAARTIQFAAHKGGKRVRHALTPAVAQALASYLRQERPASGSEHVFLRQRRPYLRLSPVAITQMVRLRMEGCGLRPVGPHALRHAFATRLLRAGQPVQAIAGLLGHRSLSAVAIYAKVDFERLLECAVDWPEVLP